VKVGKAEIDPVTRPERGGDEPAPSVLPDTPWNPDLARGQAANHPRFAEDGAWITDAIPFADL